MGFTEPDTPPTPPGQMPQAGTPGPAPAPYGGVNERPEPPSYMAAGVSWNLPQVEVMNGYPANPMTAVQESGYAHDVSAGLVVPYYAGAISPIGVYGDPDAGGRDDVSGTAAGAVANATGRYMEHESDTHGGGVIGDLMHFPPAPLDPGAGVGNTMPAGGFYDPPRGYGGDQGAPGYQGEAQ